MYNLKDNFLINDECFDLLNTLSVQGDKNTFLLLLFISPLIFEKDKIFLESLVQKG